MKWIQSNRFYRTSQNSPRNIPTQHRKHTWLFTSESPTSEFLILTCSTAVLHQNCCFWQTAVMNSCYEGFMKKCYVHSLLALQLTGQPLLCEKINPNLKIIHDIIHRLQPAVHNYKTHYRVVSVSHIYWLLHLISVNEQFSKHCME